ncbi:MAG: hypothetical protein HKO92_07970 [Flavobacteriaceae bacterium]|nr:hypothetical protein [Flavobacteriaceae bacterium]
MLTLHQTFLDIGMILDDESDKSILEKKLCSTNYDFDNLVIIGSQHLVLPTIYCKLHKWNLIHFLPEELATYLEKLTTINRNRNKTILSEIKSISAKFLNDGITYSFLKGSALLVGGYYEDIGERMIGDIDVLVSKDQLQQAQNLLLNNNYIESDFTIGDKYFEQKHLPRLIPKNKLCAVEIHQKLLHKKISKQLSSEDYLNHSKKIDNISIGASHDLFYHSVMNFQINDYGHLYNFLGLRSAYDTLLLRKKLNSESYNKLLSIDYIKNLAYKMSLYFIPFKDEQKNISSSLSFISFKNKQKYKWYRKICYWVNKLNHFFLIILNRIYHFVFNSSYRKDIIKDRKRIISILRNGSKHHHK